MTQAPNKVPLPAVELRLSYTFALSGSTFLLATEGRLLRMPKTKKPASNENGGSVSKRIRLTSVNAVGSRPASIKERSTETIAKLCTNRCRAMWTDTPAVRSIGPSCLSVMIEAMACGTPVIAFRSGSVPEVIGRVRERFEKRFTAGRMAADYVLHYQSAVNRIS